MYIRRNALRGMGLEKKDMIRVVWLFGVLVWV